LKHEHNLVVFRNRNLITVFCQCVDST